MRLIPHQELCKELDISRQTLWRLRRDAGFPEPVKLGSLLRFDADEVHEWLVTKKRQAGEVSSADQ